MSPAEVSTCGNCGRRTPARHKKCVYCAEPLEAAAAAAAPPPPKEGDHHEPRMLGGKKRFTRQSDDRGHFLLVGSGEPVELDPGKLFVMGRDPRASLVVYAEDVSRQHAEIDWDDKDPPRPLLAEVRSLNGTYLSGSLVERGSPLPMRSGDEVRLGDTFTLLYLNVTERELRHELQERGREATREFRVAERSASGRRRAPEPIDAAPAPARGESNLGELVSAALGETTLAPVEEAGDFSKFHGQLLIKRLYNEQKSGVLTVFDGTVVGEMILIEGRCRHAILGVREGREALEYVAKLGQGAYRFREEDPDLLAAAPPPAEVDENGLALWGDFSTLAGADLVRDLVQRKTTGVLTVFGGAESGHLVLRAGVCDQVALGRRVDREALDAIVRMERGVYRFRPADPGYYDAGPDPDAELPYDGTYDVGYEADAWSEYDSLRQVPPTTSRMPSSSPLRPSDDDAGVLRRSGTPMRPPLGSSPLGSSPLSPPAGRAPVRRKRPPPPPPQRRRERRPPPPRPR